ncbi:MAG TPA: TIGR01777 family oxidoreductase [Acidobacteriaceae bacterium]|nr:TIGR01777 family oxidoreductase [Acidobacteriaceae bacterium]
MGIEGRKILVSGASGLIGSALVSAARGKSADVVRLARGYDPPAPTIVYWNLNKPKNPVHPVVLEDFDAVVHLSGANIARRWTEKYRREIVASRIASTAALCETLAQVRRHPRVLLCASAVGIYGDRGDEVLSEQSAPGSGFLAETCVAWEAATRAACRAGIRVVHLRFGVVLDSRGGALKKMLRPFRLGLGGTLGSGRQWMSWISLGDAVRAILYLMENDNLAGAFNLTAPNPVTNRTFTRALAETVRRPALLPVPAQALRLAFGAMADEGLLASCRAVPKQLQQAGFGFEDPEIKPALAALLR